MKAQRSAPLKKLRGDPAYSKVYDTFVAELTHHPVVRKSRLKRLADVPSWRNNRWGVIVRFVEAEQDRVYIVPLMEHYFYRKNDPRRPADPRKYIAPNHTLAAGFADLAGFASLSELDRQIARARCAQQEITAARSLRKAEMLNDVISGQPAVAANSQRSLDQMTAEFMERP